jgi:hypothetical protein
MMASCSRRGLWCPQIVENKEGSRLGLIPTPSRSGIVLRIRRIGYDALSLFVVGIEVEHRDIVNMEVVARKS